MNDVAKCSNPVVGDEMCSKCIRCLKTEPNRLNLVWYSNFNKGFKDGNLIYCDGFYKKN